MSFKFIVDVLNTFQLFTNEVKGNSLYNRNQILIPSNHFSEKSSNHALPETLTVITSTNTFFRKHVRMLR